MPNNIDTRVVEMQFNNGQFEQGVRTSTQSLEAFKQSLNFNGVEKNFNISGVTADVEKTGSVFQRLGNHVPNVMKSAGRAMLGFGKTAVATTTAVGGALTAMTIKGGVTRAMNLKQADFMLQGLVKDQAEVDKIMKNVADSVDGTAYSLDQAALVAAQFSATGMRGSQDLESGMGSALRGVAGAAAVFGADYQRVGQIFTQVSGQGRLMGNDLLQLSSMGMNAAATLAQYFQEVKGQSGTTEAAIRDMVSKGEIDFQTFADAMNWAFGDQAAKANETFSGALANLKSAFSRIGEKVASPVIDAMRDIFNAIRPLVNMINSYLTPDLEKLGDVMSKVGEAAANMFTWFAEGSKSWTYLNGEAIAPMEIAFRSIHKIMYELSRLLTPIKEAFFDVFNPSRNGITEFLKKFMEMAFNFNFSAQTIDNLRNTFRGLFAVIDLLVRGFGALLKVASPLFSALGSVVSFILALTGRIGNAIYNFDQMTKSSASLGGALEFLASIGKAVMDIFSAFVGSLTDVLSVSTGLKEMKSSAQGAGQVVGGAFSKIADGINAFGKGVSSVIHGIDFDFIKKVISAGLLIKFGQILNKMIDLMVGGIQQVKSAGLGAIFDEVRTSLVSFQSYLKAEILMKLAKAIAILTASLVVLSMLDTKKMAGGLAALAIMMAELTAAVAVLFKIGASKGKGLVGMATALTLLAVSVAILTGAMAGLSTMSLTELGKGLLGLAGISVILVGVATALSKASGRIVRGAGSLILFAIAIRILTTAVESLGSMDVGKLTKGLIGVGVLVGELMVMMSSFNKGGGLVKAGGILILAYALGVLSDAVLKLGGGKVSSLTKGIAAIGLILTELSLFAKTTKNAGSLLVTAVGITILAQAMQVFSQVIGVLGGMSIAELAKGILSLGAALVVIGASMRTMPSNMVVTGAGLIIVAEAIKILSSALMAMSGMSMAEIGKSLIALGGGLVVIAAAMKLMQGSIVGAAAMLVMAAAIRIFTPAMMQLASLSLQQIGVGLLALAGAFTVLGLAGLILAPIAPGILILAAAVAAMGVAAALAGAGVALFATGMAALAAMGPAELDGFVATLETIAQAIPEIFRMIGEGIVSMIQTIGDSAVQIAEVGVQLIVGLLTAVNNHIGEISSLGAQIIANFLNGIAENVDSVIEAGFNLMVSFINGLANGLEASQGDIMAAIANLTAAILTFTLSAFQSILGELPVVGEKIASGLEEAKKAVNEKLKPDEGQKTGQQYGEGISSGLGKGADKAKPAGEKYAKNAAQGANKPNLMKAASEKMGSAYNTALGKAASKTKSAGAKFPKEAAAGADKSTGMKKAGESSGNDYNKALSKKSSDSKSAGKKVAESAKSGAGSVKGFSGLGSSAGAGFVSGARSHSGAAYSAGWALASSYYNAIKARLSIKSPSKATAKLAMYGVKGFVNETYDYLGAVKKAGLSVGQAMLDGMQQVQNGTKLTTDMFQLPDTNPVLKPVVDLSAVKSAAKQTEDLFTDLGAINMAASIGSKFNNPKINAQNNEVLMTELLDKIDSMSANSAQQDNQIDPKELYSALKNVQRGDNNTFNVYVDGSEDPEDFAIRFVRQIQIEMETRNS